MKRRAIPAISLALVVLFSASFLLALPGAVSMPASAVTQAEIDALKESAGELEQQQKEIQAQLNAIAADKDEALEQKSLLEQQINVIQSEINNIDAQIAKYDELISRRRTNWLSWSSRRRSSISSSVSGCAIWRRRGRSPIGPSSLTRRISLTCWTAS